jgi:hypothetical protein
VRRSRRPLGADRFDHRLPHLPLLACRPNAGTHRNPDRRNTGHPDNINRASDGNYWLALVGVRTPSFDLSMEKAAFRRRMAKQVPTDEWLGPNLNYGCVVKFDEAGNVLESYWDPTGISQRP